MGNRSLFPAPFGASSVGGSLGDRYGRRHVFVIGVFIFNGAFGVVRSRCGSLSLIMARAVGFGALLVPGSLAIISSSFREEDRGRYRHLVWL
jgi:MFS family permease